MTVRRVQQTPVLSTLDSATLGTPSVRLEIATGAAALWLVRMADTVLVVGLVRDPTRAWNDEVVVSLHLAGPAASVPQHEDFQWALRRALDSSVVYRGRGNRWEPPRSDPDWRLGPDYSGGGWTVEAREVTGGWWLMLRLEGPWLERSSRLAVRVRDSESPDWASWPRGKTHASEVEASPALWGLVRE